MSTVYGLEKCDTCRKARNWLQRFGIQHEFVDYRENRAEPETLKHWALSLGGWDALVNRQSTTWRSLPPARKMPASDPEWTLLLREHPAIIKRPLLITDDGAVSAGFSDALFKRRFGR